MITLVYHDELIFFHIIKEQCSTIRDGPNPMVRVFVDCRGIFEGIVAFDRSVQPTLYRLWLMHIACEANDTRIIGCNPYTMIVTLDDVTHINIAHQETTLRIGECHTDTGTLSHKHRSIVELAEGVHISITYKRGPLTRQQPGWFASPTYHNTL